MQRKYPLLNWYLYSNLHIAVCAACYCVAYFPLIGYEFSSYYWLFLFGSTLSIYCIHRFVGLGFFRKSGIPSERYSQIQKMISDYPILLILGVVLSIYSLFQLPRTFIPYLIPTMVISLAYITPVFAGKRLRDFPFIKIFLIGSVYAWLSVAFLIYSQAHIPQIIISLLFVESILFMLAITLPFDIRDIDIDSNTQVRTIANTIGESRTKVITGILLVFSLLLIALSMFLLIEQSLLIIAYVPMYLLAFSIITRITKTSRDIMTTGYLDGMLIIKGLTTFAILNFGL